MVHYSALGFVNTKKMFEDAMKNGYAVPAYNFNNMEQLQAIITACTETSSPVILQVSKGARNYANEILLRWIGQGALELMKDLAKKENLKEIPIALHLDHGDSFELCKSCIDAGFSSVMIDGSHFDYDKNVELTSQVVEYARKYNVTVEGELGVLAGIEDDVKSEKNTYTNPDDVEDFVKKTNVNSLAIAIGTSHGAYKFKVKPGEVPPPLRFDILEKIEKRIPGFPIVLHGASSVLKEYVDIINRYGGKIENAVGISEDQLRKAAKSAVCKINIDSDGRLAMTAKIREVLWNKPSEFDPRKYLGPAREELIKMYKHKNESVLGSARRIM